MADFRQLALEFVLADNEAAQQKIAQTAATELQNGPANSNPVARWVEAVQPWMPGSAGDEGEEATDWTARAKALEFLSQTLDHLGREVLKPSQVKLLVAFFGAMFEVDHKAGIMASATALSRIAAMKSFQPQSGNEIIQKVCALKDDFPRQVAKTRLEVYNLLKQLISNADVASDLQYRHGAASGFMNDLLQLCRSERDPDCLMVWFDILKIFMQEFSPSQEILEEVYGNFKAYFPITLPRTSQTKITPEQLKLQLRQCFSSTYRLAALSIPFLVGKLDQGDGVTVNVKVDILRTIKACLEEYIHTEQSVTPYVNQIWGSLKYEVRNGEVEDTIWATLEVLKSLATKLQGDDLRDYSLTVTRDCVNDLSNPTYTAAAGRLLISVLSANPRAFVLMASPTITHIKENLRHPKSPLHTQDLLKILHVVLETRILLVGTEMSAADASDFGAVDPVIKSLYEDVYRNQLSEEKRESKLKDDVKVMTQAVQGAGALVCQQSAKAGNPLGDLGNSLPSLLLPQATCSEISNSLFTIVSKASLVRQSDATDELTNETTTALARIARTYTSAFKPLVDQGIAMIRESWTGSRDRPAGDIQGLALILAFIGCSELASSPADGLGHFLYFAAAIVTELFAALDQNAHPSVWCSLAAGLQSAARYFNDACLTKNPEKNQSFDSASWLDTITQKYPELQALGAGNADSVMTDAPSQSSNASLSVPETRKDFLLICLYVVRQLYRRATRPHSDEAAGKEGLHLSGDFSGDDAASEYQYLHLISGFAGFAIHELSEEQQKAVQVEQYAVNLFQQETVQIPQTLSEEQKQAVSDSAALWEWLVQGRVNVLCLGVLESLRPSAVTRLFDLGVAQGLLFSGAFPVSAQADATTRPVTQSIVTILANKHKIEALPALMTALQEKSADILAKIQSDSSDANVLDWVNSIYAIANGMLRRGGGKDARPLVELLREGPKSSALGHHLARRFEMLVAPQSYLTKDNFAVVKPLWMQRVYFELVKPMLQQADGSNQDVVEPVKTNHGIAVLSMVKHMDFSIFEDDAASIIRVCILIAQNTGAGPDTQTSLQIIREILPEASEKLKGHLQSLVKICIQSFSANSRTVFKRAEWLPSDYDALAQDPKAAAACGKLSLDILGIMPQIFEAAELSSFAPQVGRELTVACGHQVRDVRRSARLARSAWANLK